MLGALWILNVKDGEEKQTVHDNLVTGGLIVYELIQYKIDNNSIGGPLWILS